MPIVSIVAGAQYGSEAKGHVTAQVVRGYRKNSKHTPVINVRVAGPNAGHTVVDDNGQHIALRQIPVGAAISDEVILFIAPGSEIEVPLVVQEVEHLRDLGHPVTNLYIDPEATILTEGHKQTERDLELTERLGSTAKGIGAARADRILRGADRLGDNLEAQETLARHGIHVMGHADLYDQFAPGSPAAVVIEGTQGYGLGLHAGEYPYCTSSDTRAIDFLAMSGYPWSPFTSVEVILVARMYPIRVAGNSGAMNGETSWDDLGLPEEKTTVTQKTRRVADWDMNLIRQAYHANGGMDNDETIRRITDRRSGVGLILTMVDQKWPALEGMQGSFTEFMEGLKGNPEALVQAEELASFINELEGEGIQVKGFTTSPSTIVTL